MRIGGVPYITYHVYIFVMCITYLAIRPRSRRHCTIRMIRIHLACKTNGEDTEIIIALPL